MVTELTRARFAALRKLLAADGETDRWLVLTHDNPDPDCLAAAASLALLLGDVFGRRVTTAYAGIIGRAENQQMVKTLGLKLSHVRHLQWGNYGRFALVDCQQGTGNNHLPDEVSPDLVFDHHPRRRATRRARFADVRTDYGATATILAEYLFASGAEIGKQIATALVYAIRSETQDFGREYSEPDKAVYDELHPRADIRALAKIQAPPLPLGYFRTLHQAVERLETVSTLVVSHLDEVDQPDIVPEMADLLLRIEGKTWALCTGVYEDKLYLSLRTTNARADAGNLMRRLLGRQGRGGGHGMTAGGWFPLEATSDGDAREVQGKFASRLAQLLKKKSKRLRPLDLGLESHRRERPAP